MKISIEPHFQISMPNNIVLFTLNGCDHCVNLKKRLSKLSIPYKEIETTENEVLWDKIVEETGHDLLPTTLIMNDENDESFIYIPGVDYQTEDEIVEIIKSYT